MNKPYSGNARPFVLALFAPDDRDRVLPVLDELDTRGYALCGQDGKATASQAKRACAVVAFLSAAFAADEAAQATLLAADAADVPLLPVHLDDAEQPELVRRALLATNALDAARYDAPSALVERLCAAGPLANPQVTPAQRAAGKRVTGLLVAAALCVVGAVVALLLSRAPATEDTSASLQAAALYGLTEEDLANIRSLTIVGEHVTWATAEDYLGWEGRYPNLWDCAGRNEQQDDGAFTVRWYWNEDGSETTFTAYDDLSFITLMPKLQVLSVANADIAAMPSLASLEQLQEVNLWNDDLGEGELSFLAGSSVRTMNLSYNGLDSYAQLNDCAQLEELYIDTLDDEANLEGFAPPALKSFTVEAASGDLASLAGCTQLESLSLMWARDAQNLDFLAGRDTLKSLHVENCERLTDASALASCPNLEYLHFNWEYELRDLSFLNGLTKLSHVELLSVPVHDFAFLANIEHKDGFSLGFCPSEPNQVDWSGLESISHYGYLHVNPNNSSVADILSHLANATVDEIDFHECDGLDLSAIPKAFGWVKIEYGDLQNLTGLDQPYISELQLYNMSYLTSLDGIEGAPGVLKASMSGNKLEVYNCPRLVDWSALKGQHLNRLELKYLFELPDFALLDVDELRLEGIVGLADLSCFDALPTGRLNSVELVALDDVRDLRPLARLSGSGNLTVPPQLEEQAQALVEDGVFGEYRVEVPEGNWNPIEDMRVELVSLDDLDTLPAALLAQVEQLKLAGATIFDWSEDSWYEWDERENDGKGCMVRVTDDGKAREPLGEGTLTDLSRLAPLTGLRELVLFGQPLTSLEGLQDFTQLERLQLNWIGDVEDFSPIFACPGLRGLDLPGVGITSIQGIQNLTELEEVTLSWNLELTDLTPLLDCPNLQHVRVSSNMEEALASIEGADLGFELEVEQAGE